MELSSTHLGSTVIYVGPRGELVPAVITRVLSATAANLSLIPDGPAHAHILPFQADVSYHPPHPVEGPKPNTWITRGQIE